MRKNIAKGIVVGSLILGVGMTSFGSVANAESAQGFVKTKNSRSLRAKMVKAQKGHKRTLPGRVVSVAGTTLVVERGKRTFTVEAAGVLPVDRHGAEITLGQIKPGHKVSIRGTVTGQSVVDVLKLRDVSLPVRVAK